MSMHKEAILGIDIGTSSIKCCFFDYEGKELLASSSEYSLLNPSPGVFEIDTEVIWKAVIEAIKKVLLQSEGNSKNYRISAIGICAMMIMPVLLDNDNNVIRPIIHWFDERLQSQYYKLKKSGKDKIIADISGSSLTGEGTLNALDWVRENEPLNFARINKFFMIKDFVGFKMTGSIMSDYGDASGSQMLDTKKWNWPGNNREVIEGLNIKRSIFPDLANPQDLRGKLSREASNLTGLPEGIPVAIGSGDGITTIFGLGTYRDGQTGLIVGSAGVLASSAKNFPEDNKLRTYIFCHPFCDRWYSLMATASSGEVFRWYYNSIVKSSDVSMADLDKEAASVAPGSDGVMFLPYLLGSRNPYSNPGATGVFLGIRYKHERKHLTRAVLEGISFELLDLLKIEEEILAKNNINISEIKLAGGIVNSRFWMQLLSDILQKDLVTTSVKELGALGSAVIASVAAGFYKDLETAVKKMVRDGRVIKRNPALKGTYEEKFKLFREMYKTLENKFEKFV
jgi:xylulokinase